MNRLPASVRATDVIHRLSVLGLLGFSAFVTYGIGYNIYMNSDTANEGKLRFNKSEVEETRQEVNSRKLE
mgnify:FL=1